MKVKREGWMKLRRVAGDRGAGTKRARVDQPFALEESEDEEELDSPVRVPDEFSALV